MEAFVKIKRVLRERDIHLILCSLGSIGAALNKVGLFEEEDGQWVHSAKTLNEALEWAENNLLRIYYTKHSVVRGYGKIKINFVYKSV